MAHASHHHDIEPPDKLELSKGFTTAAIILAVIGAIVFAVGLYLEPGRAWRGYVMGLWFTLGIALIGPFFAATQYLSKAGWSVGMRRIPEAFGAYILPGIIFFVIILAFGVDTLFAWLDPAVFDPSSYHYDAIVAEKEGFLNKPMMWVLTLVPLSIAGLLFWRMRSNSLAQDEEGGYGLMQKNLWVSAFYIIAFALTVSFVSWYWLMSYDPHWYSMMWSVHAFAGAFQAGLALMTLILIYMLRKGLYGKIVGTEQVHRMGQLVFGFTVFYAYIHFSQFLLLWYANIPETAKWYVNRMSEGWGIFLLLIPLFRFIVPFLALLRQKAKKNAGNVLVYMCVLIIAMQAYELWLWVMPYWYHDPGLRPPTLPWMEVGIILGFIGVFMLVVGRSLAKHNLVPLKDPLLAEAIPHSHDHLIYPNGKPGESGQDDE